MRQTRKPDIRRGANHAGDYVGQLSAWAERNRIRRVGDVELGNPFPIMEKAELLDVGWLPVVKHSKPRSDHSLAATRRIRQSKTRGEIPEGVSVRLSLVTQAQHQGEIRPQFHFVLREGIELMLGEGHFRSTCVDRE